MVTAGVAVSTRGQAREAADEAVGGALAQLEAAGPVSAGLLFAGPAHSEDLPLLLDAVCAGLGTDTLVGATAYGVLGGGAELAQPSALVLVALAGIEAVPVLLEDAGERAAQSCREIAARLGGPPRPEDLLVLLPDPRSFAAQSFLPALDESLRPARVVGAGAGDPMGGEPLQWAGRVVASGGLAGLVLRGEHPPAVGVTQACRPASGLLTVTRTRGHWLLELDGRPALEVYREHARGPLASDLARSAAFLLVGLPIAPDAETMAPGSYLVRHVVGFQPEANAFALPQALPVGSRLALVQREPESAREDLKAMLAGLPAPATPPACALYFDCCARGAGFFGVDGLEAAYLDRALAPAPVAGMFGSCEIGPIGGATELLTYTGVLAVL